MNPKDYRIISALRQNSRQTLTAMSRAMRIPISTLFDRIKTYERGILRRHTSLLDFGKLGYLARATVMVKCDASCLEDVGSYLNTHAQLNSVSRINSGYDYSFEAIFRSMPELEEFVQHLDRRFALQKVDVHYIIDDLKKEAFLLTPESAA